MASAEEIIEQHLRGLQAAEVGHAGSVVEESRRRRELFEGIAQTLLKHQIEALPVVTTRKMTRISQDEEGIFRRRIVERTEDYHSNTVLSPGWLITQPRYVSGEYEQDGAVLTVKAKILYASRICFGRNINIRPEPGEELPEDGIYLADAQGVTHTVDENTLLQDAAHLIKSGSQRRHIDGGYPDAMMWGRYDHY